MADYNSSYSGTQIDAAVAAVRGATSLATAGSPALITSGGVAAALALKAPIDSPNLTGTPTTTHPDASSNSARIATTKFVQDKYTDAIRFVNENKQDKTVYVVYNTDTETAYSKLLDAYETDGPPEVILIVGNSSDRKFIPLTNVRWLGNTRNDYGFYFELFDGTSSIRTGLVPNQTQHRWLSLVEQVETAPSSSDTKLVTSGGVYRALNAPAVAAYTISGVKFTFVKMGALVCVMLQGYASSAIQTGGDLGTATISADYVPPLAELETLDLTIPVTHGITAIMHIFSDGTIQVGDVSANVTIGDFWGGSFCYMLINPNA